MSITEGRLECNTSYPDLQFFIGASEFFDTAANAARGSAGAGLFALNLTAGQVGTFFANLELYIRTGVYGTTAYDQEQYGTAASVPGPSTVANTSGPLAELPGFPPMVAANMPTLGGIQRGPIPKGTQIDSVDIIYNIGAVNASTATIGLTKTVFADGVAPAVTNLIALGSNGMPVAFQANPHVFNVAVGSPAMITSSDTEVVLNVNLTAGAATGTVAFYGVVVHCHYNFN
jgi:hypothetical protein